MRLNIKTFSALLRALESGLKISGDGGPSAYNKNQFGSGIVTAKIRRILPNLRHYSSWLVSQAAILAGETADPSLNTLARELGKLYIQVLNLLIVAFPVLDLPSIEYMLEEDEDTIGFVPLDGPYYDHIKLRYYGNDLVTRKPKWHEKGVRRLHSSKEMLGRIRDLVADGLYLHTQEVGRTTDGSRRSY